MTLRCRTLLLIAALTSAALAHADPDLKPEPVWELGAGLAALHLPHYLGAEQQSNYVFPLPYFIYRGDIVRADRGGLRGMIYDSEKLDLRMSFSGSLPVNSEDNDARSGMDDLDLMMEIGPTLQYQIYLSDRQLLRADLPIRGAFSLGSHLLNHQGWTSNPRLYHELALDGWTVTSTFGPVFSDRRYHGRIYDVAPQYANASRREYRAESGFTGLRLSSGIKRRIGNYRIGAHLSYYDLHGVANEDSPLMKQQDYLSASLFFAWIFKQSRETTHY